MREQTVLHQPPHVILGCQSTFIKAHQGMMVSTLGSDAGVLNLSEYHIQTLMTEGSIGILMTESGQGQDCG